MKQLERDLDREEIHKVIFGMAPWKFHGTNGFPVDLYQKSWNVVGNKCEGKDKF